MQKKSKYHHGNLKEELLKLSLKTIIEEGVDVLTLKLLADKLGTSRSAIYRHFDSKEDLIENVISYCFGLFEEKLIPFYYLKETAIIEKLRLMSRAYVDFAIENPNIYKILFGEKFQDIREKNCTMTDEDLDDSFTLLINLIIEGKEKELFKIENPFLEAMTIFSFLHGLSSLYVDGHNNIKNNIDELFENSFNLIITGLQTKH